MKKLIVAVALAALVAAPPAAAKEIETLAVCGASGCEEMSHDQSAQFIAVFEGGTGAGGGGQIVLGAVPIRDYYKIGVKVRGDNPPPGGYSFTAWFVPPNYFHLNDPSAVAFKRLPASLAAALSRAVQSVTPYPMPRVISAYVGDKKSAHPVKYIDLFRKLASNRRDARRHEQVDQHLPDAEPREPVVPKRRLADLLVPLAGVVPRKAGQDRRRPRADDRRRRWAPGTCGRRERLDTARRHRPARRLDSDRRCNLALPRAPPATAAPGAGQTMSRVLVAAAALLLVRPRRGPRTATA